MCIYVACVRAFEPLYRYLVRRVSACLDAGLLLQYDVCTPHAAVQSDPKTSLHGGHARRVVNVNTRETRTRGRSPVLTSQRDTCRHRSIDVYTGVLGVDMKTLPVKAAREPTK